MPLSYTRELTDDEVAALEHMVPDAAQWIDTAINEKIANCKKRLIREYVDNAIENNLPLPSEASAVFSTIVTQKDYMNRKQRDAADGPAGIEPTPVDLPLPAPDVAQPAPTEEISDGQPT